MKILVIGGAGYIGSHMVKQLSKEGHKVVILDSLVTGFHELAIYGHLVTGDLKDTLLLEKLFNDNKFDAVMHFAASSLVGESMVNPSKYYQNNVVGTLGLLDIMIRNDVKNFIFSSTAAIFGEPEYTPIDEYHAKQPISPYGASKLMVERILQDYALAYGLNSVSLRYFNACGADPDGELGECHEPETHLIPLVLQVATGKRDSIKVFGRDYPTKDGTCVRDYIHVLDISAAHSMALKYLMKNSGIGALAFNLGNGAGYSVAEVIEVAKKVTAFDGFPIKVEEGARRQGDPAILVADSRLAKKTLGWKPHFFDLNSIIGHAWQWEKNKARVIRN